MTVKDAVVMRFKQICSERNIKYNELANISGVTPSTIYSMLDDSRRDISIITIKKFCDGLAMSLSDFFTHPIFEGLEQEIQYFFYKYIYSIFQKIKSISAICRYPSMFLLLCKIRILYHKNATC